MAVYVTCDGQSGHPHTQIMYNKSSGKCPLCHILWVLRDQHEHSCSGCRGHSHKKISYALPTCPLCYHLDKHKTQTGNAENSLIFQQKVRTRLDIIELRIKKQTETISGILTAEIGLIRSQLNTQNKQIKDLTKSLDRCGYRISELESRSSDSKEQPQHEDIQTIYDISNTNSDRITKLWSLVNSLSIDIKKVQTERQDEPHITDTVVTKIQDQTESIKLSAEKIEEELEY